MSDRLPPLDPYLPLILLDGWGQPLESTVATHPPKPTWTFRSLGADGRPGTHDDLQATTLSPPPARLTPAPP